MLTLLRNMIVKDDGQGMVEYALIIVLIAIAVIGALTLMGGSVQNVFNDITSNL
ncbi:MAG: Flp family type IVb pilin [Syntrophomonadaceae bacterium]|nr:Flp family type IVb pilin [Syntrophomonadaceae bacterium]